MSKKNLIIIVPIAVVLLIAVIVGVNAVNAKKVDLSNNKYEDFADTRVVEPSTEEIAVEETTESSVDEESKYEPAIEGEVKDNIAGGSIDGFDISKIETVGLFNVNTMPNCRELCEELYPIFGENLYNVLKELNNSANMSYEYLGEMMIMDTLRLERDETFGWQWYCDLIDGGSVFIAAVNSNQDLNEGSVIYADENMINRRESYYATKEAEKEEPSSGWTEDGQRMWWYDEDGNYVEAQGE